MKHPNPRIDSLLNSGAAVTGIDLSLDRMEALLTALGNPHLQLPPVVHVAGTNGKGSLLAYLTAILQAAGYHVHRYTSPHLVRFNERIMLAGRETDDHTLLDNLKRVSEHLGAIPVTRFEADTAAAFLAFHETEADILLLETGLGGRLDATNVVPEPLLTAITPVSMDHMDYLGPTLAGIAAEKAGILKRNVPCIVGPQTPEALSVIENAATPLNAPLLRYGKEWSAERKQHQLIYNGTPYPLPNLAGEHQWRNAAAAIACAKHLPGFTITDAHIAQGLTHAVWPARLQLLDSGALATLMPQGPELWLDGGHNADAALAISHWAMEQKKPVHLILGMLATKDVGAFLAPFAPYVKSVTGVPIDEEPKAHSPRHISDMASRAGLASRESPGLAEAVQAINYKEGNNCIILICGSLYLAGNALWQNSQPSLIPPQIQ